MSALPSGLSASGASRVTLPSVGGGGLPGGGGSGPPIEMRVDLTDVLTMLGGVPPILRDVLTVRFYDVVTHHRRSVLSHQQMPQRIKAQRFLASVMHRYVRPAPPSVGKLGQMNIMAEHFAAATGDLFARDAITKLETGGIVRTQKPMAIPTGRMMTQTARGGVALPAFAKGLEARRYDVFGSGNLVDTRAKGKFGGLRSELAGVLRRSRRQRPLLGFFRQWASVTSRQSAKFERDLDLVLTEAGRVKLDRMITSSSAKNEETFVRRLKRAGVDLADSPQVKAHARLAGGRVERLGGGPPLRLR